MPAVVLGKACSSRLAPFSVAQCRRSGDFDMGARWGDCGKGSN